MIFQGLFNILDHYLTEIDLFYNTISKYFREKLNDTFGSLLVEKEKPILKLEEEEIIELLFKELENLGFNRIDLESKFADKFLEIREDELEKISSGLDIYEIKIAPIVYEIFLEKVVDYLVDLNAMNIMLKLKEKELLPIEFILRLTSMKNTLKKYPEKLENLKKYIQIREKIIQKLLDNRDKIESFEDLEDPTDKLQLLYLIYRIIDFFHLQKLFDFSHIKNYLAKNIDEWLNTIPLITLKNPDLYYCGIYLADELEVEIDKQKVNDFLQNLYEENIDEFESPLFEATDRIYYYLKSTSTVKYRLNEEQIKELIKADSKFYDPQYLNTMETSQLVVILKLYHYLGVYQRIEDRIIDAIIVEIDRRIASEGIKQFRDGFVSSEATYYVLFCSYMTSSIDKLSGYDLLDNIISRIYRNLEILYFSREMNHDLVSEIFYSCESLKLLNCIETKQMIRILAEYLFPKEIAEETLKNEKIARSTVRFRHFKVNQITGETMF